ncbi:MAG: hypothetical protein JXB49_02655 [Bacteroidales bacterium]|nr:hypothetical protein [Bacteroidales bacterium]MBN2864153.1 hypothetical protein [Bacteroidales bacterium]
MKCTKCQAEWTPPRDHTVTVCPFCSEPFLDLKNIDKNTELYEILAMIVKQQGTSIIGERVLKGMLSDYLPNLEKKYHNVLSKTFDDRIGQQLLDLANEEESVRKIKTSNLKESFKTNNGFDSSADYVIDSFLYALRWIDEVVKPHQQQSIDTLVLLNKQIEIAFIDGVLNKEEAISIFESARAMGISDDLVSDIIEKKISELDLSPDTPIERDTRNRKNKIVSRNWIVQSKIEQQKNSISNETKHTSHSDEIELKKIVKKKFLDDYGMQKFVNEIQLTPKEFMINVKDLEVKNIAEVKYPNDYQLQKYVYETQLTAKEFMINAKDMEVKNIAEVKYPNDYQLQKYVYETQLTAKALMINAKDLEVKNIAEKKYPNDYQLQKYVYETQLTAKEFMINAKDLEIKNIAGKKYPNDYQLQKYVYETQLTKGI